MQMSHFKTVKFEGYFLCIFSSLCLFFYATFLLRIDRDLNNIYVYLFVSIQIKNCTGRLRNKTTIIKSLFGSDDMS